jgi:Toastrack DUF4097
MNIQSNQSGEKKSYRVLLLLVVGLAAFSSAMNELNELQNFTRQASQLMASWSETVMPTARASSPIVAASCVQRVVKVSAPQNLVFASLTQDVSRTDEFRWNGMVAPGASIEVKGINGEIVAEPASGTEVQVVAEKRSRNTDVNSVQIKVVQHAGGVTICALYPNEYGEYRDCGPGDSERKNGSGNIRNNDVQVNFTVKVPDRVGFIGKTVNGRISATSLTGNVVTRTVNGEIKLSTTGYAEATTVNGEIAARLGNAVWPSSLTFKTVNGEINIDLPATVSTEVDAETLNGSINSDFPLEVTNLKGKKHVKGTIGTGGRDLILKTLNGSINLRRAG